MADRSAAGRAASAAGRMALICSASSPRRSRAVSRSRSTEGTPFASHRRVRISSVLWRATLRTLTVFGDLGRDAAQRATVAGTRRCRRYWDERRGVCGHRLAARDQIHVRDWPGRLRNAGSKAGPPYDARERGGPVAEAAWPPGRPGAADARRPNAESGEARLGAGMASEFTTVGRLLHQGVLPAARPVNVRPSNAQFDNARTRFWPRAGDLGRHEEEAVGNFKNQPRRRRRSRTGGKAIPYRLRLGAQRSLGERGTGPRHPGLRGGVNSSLVSKWAVTPTPTQGYRLPSRASTVGDETRTIHVSHFPPGTSKWNKIEHRLFCHITANWRGTPVDRIEHPDGDRALGPNSTPASIPRASG